MATRCYQLALQGLLVGSYRETLLHFQSGNTADNDTVAGGENLLAAFDASLKAAWLATLPSAYVLVRAVARRADLLPSAGTCKFYGTSGAVGTRATDATAQQTSPSIFLVPTMGTKSGGKIFWPAIPQADLTDNVSSTAWQTVVNTFLSTAISGITSGAMTWVLCIFSRKLHTMSTVASHSFSSVVGFQGKRRKPVGAV